MKSDKRELIRQSAIKIFYEEGFHQATTDRIAAEAGVSVGTIYNYFRSKEDVLGYIFQVELEKRIRFLEGLRKQDLSIADKFSRFLAMHFAQVKEDPALANILIRERNLPHKRSVAVIEDFQVRILEHFEGMLEEALRKKEIHPCNPKLAALMVFGAIEAVVSRAVGKGGGRLDQGFLEEAAKDLPMLLFRGFGLPDLELKADQPGKQDPRIQDAQEIQPTEPAAQTQPESQARSQMEFFLD